MFSKLWKTLQQIRHRRSVISTLGSCWTKDTQYFVRRLMVVLAHVLPELLGVNELLAADDTIYVIGRQSERISRGILH